MGVDLNKLETEISPLLEVHGVELVALEWLQGPGHGILRLAIDRPGGDPRITDIERQVTLTEVTDVTRDVSSALDALDLIEGNYTLEIGSPGPNRPVQKRADFDRFAGLTARIDARDRIGGRGQFSGTLRGTVDHAEGGFAVKIDVAGKVYEVPFARIARTRLHEIVPPARTKPAKGASSRRQERLQAREQARAINAAHLLARKQAEGERPATDEGVAAQRAETAPAGEPQHEATDEKNTPLHATPGRATR